MNLRFLKIFILLVLLFTTGCNYFPQPTEINDNAFILAIGIDKGIQNKDNFLITLVSKDLKPSDNQNTSGSEQTKGKVIKYEGKSLFDITRQMHKLGVEDIFWGQAEFIVIGEELSKENINKTIDFILRDHEIRMNMPLIIARGTTAEKLLDSEKEFKNFVPDIFKNLFKNTSGYSVSKKITLKDAAVAFDSKYSDAILPSINENIYRGEAGEEKYYIELNGYAVFKEFKLLDFLTDYTARGDYLS